MRSKLPLTTENLAKIACIYSGITFGVYWIPLRALGEAGFTGSWAVLLFNLSALSIVSPVLFVRWRYFIPGRFRFHMCAIFCGAAFALYATAFMYTEVVRVLIMFYLMPIWGFLLGRILIGDKITLIRWGSMAFGLAGLFVICGGDSGLVIPNNPGDWMALAAGVLWAAGSMMLLTNPDDTVNYTIGFLFWATVGSILVVMLATDFGLTTAPNWTGLGDVLYWLVPLAVFLIIPSSLATIYGPTKLNPGVVGLFFMTEISVGTVTAAIFAGEPFGLREIIGVVLVTLAGVAETFYQIYRQRAAVLR
jgi:drug/metabolite transporter (DMT)-like permease